MDEKHDFIVYLPPLYEAEPDRRYPVLYLQDGQNLFDPDTSFIPGNYWRVGETADELIVSGAIEPLIIVGIYNTGRTSHRRVHARRGQAPWWRAGRRLRPDAGGRAEAVRGSPLPDASRH